MLYKDFYEVYPGVIPGIGEPLKEDSGERDRMISFYKEKIKEGKECILPSYINLSEVDPEWS